MTRKFADFDFTPEPHQIEEIYSSGFAGVVAEDPATTSYKRALKPSFYATFPDAVGAHTELEFALPIRGCQSLIGLDFCADRGESQRQGDCVGKMVRNQGMIDGCLDAMFGETTWKLGDDGRGVQYCCENFYGERGHAGEGANCERIWDTASPDGGQGFLFRGVYGSYDLSRYRADLSGSWGRRGTPDDLSEVARQNPALRVYQAKSVQECMDALALGFGVGRCGSDGYSNRRDDNGVSDVQGSWAHAIAVGGFDRSQRVIEKYGGVLFLHYHNWGEWNSGGKSHEQPEGSWWVRERFFERWVKSGQVAIIASVVGHERKLIWEKIADRKSMLVKEGINAACSTVPAAA